MSKKKKDEHDFIYDNGDDSGIDYSELDENEDPEEVVRGRCKTERDIRERTMP